MINKYTKLTVCQMIRIMKESREAEKGYEECYSGDGGIMF